MNVFDSIKMCSYLSYVYRECIRYQCVHMIMFWERKTQHTVFWDVVVCEICAVDKLRPHSPVIFDEHLSGMEIIILTGE